MKDLPVDQTDRIVVGVDASPGSEAALHWAMEYARQVGASLSAVAAWQYPSMYGYSWGYLPSMPDGGNFAISAEKCLEETVARVVKNQNGSMVQVATHSVEGHPAQILTDAARDARLLVVGTRGHGTFAGVLLGSVSQHCVQHASCPVVVVPQPVATSDPADE
ncbi:universal stress protein [Streptomyces sp. NPDC008079]|uniref:universal stress protein n=1 Tax=Streptomyces sp. NPDC008079 TaxID=3364806 RepID=UPI0036E6F323